MKLVVPNKWLHTRMEIYTKYTCETHKNVTYTNFFCQVKKEAIAVKIFKMRKFRLSDV